MIDWYNYTDPPGEVVKRLSDEAYEAAQGGHAEKTSKALGIMSGNLVVALWEVSEQKKKLDRAGQRIIDLETLLAKARNS